MTGHDLNVEFSSTDVISGENKLSCQLLSPEETKHDSFTGELAVTSQQNELLLSEAAAASLGEKQ